MDAAADFYGIDSRRVAVVLVDFQNDFCSPEVFGYRPATNTHNAVTAARANRFAGNAHRLGAHVIYTQQVFDPSKLTERRGYRCLVAERLVSGQDTGDKTDNRAVRDWLRYN